MTMVTIDDLFPQLRKDTTEPEQTAKPEYNTPDGEPPYTPPPATPDHAIRTILETLHDLKALKREELDSSISALKYAICRLSDAM